VSNIKSHEDSLLHHLTEKLIKIDGLKIYGSSQNKAAILSFNIDGLHHYDIGVLLDKMGIAIRTGHHCTQPIMEKYNILGTARVSLSVYNTIEEIDYFISAIQRIKNMLS
jgi:cysteine desulfurase/selenocysteine lyase